MATREPTRREFLLEGGALIVGFSLAGGALAGKAQAAVTPDPGQVDSWLIINADNTATILSGKVELGQGSSTGLLQIAGEELNDAFGSADNWGYIQAHMNDTWKQSLFPYLVACKSNGKDRADDRDRFNDPLNQPPTAGPDDSSFDSCHRGLAQPTHFGPSQFNTL